MPKWYDLAKAEKGVKEAPGAADNPVVLKYYADAGFSGIKHDSVAWCAAFANAMLERSGVRGSNSLAARSFLKWGQKLDRPVLGCIVVFKRGNSSWQGHVAFFVSETSTHVQVLGGNQSDAVNIRSFPKSKLLGYRWPANEPVEGAAADPEAEGQTTLRVGSTGWTVKALQERLKALGYHPGDIDGHFGEGTEAAVIVFQKREGLEVDGIVGPNTWAALNTAKPWIRKARAEQTKADVREKSSIMQSADAIKKTAVAVGVAGGGGKAVQEGAKAVQEPDSSLLDSAKEIVEQGKEVGGIVESFSSFFEVAWQYWWIVIPVVAAFIWWRAHKAEAARYLDEITGKTM